MSIRFDMMEWVRVLLRDFAECSKVVGTHGGPTLLTSRRSRVGGLINAVT